jgi:methylmalonyl-CoA decarboxylase
MSPAPVRSELAGNIGTIILDNASRRNALSAALLDGVIAELKKMQDQKARVIILRSAPGLKVWSAGHDISELPRGHEDPLGYADPLERALRALRSHPAPIIAMIQGSVWGGAFDLVLSCDIVIGDETAKFAITPANLGLPYNTTGLLHFLGRLPVNLVKEMFFTAAPLDAEAARKWGILNHLYPAAQLEEQVQAMASLIASKAPLAISTVKEQLRVLADFQPVAAQVFERIQEMRRVVYDSADYQEGIKAFEEKRKPVFRGV